MQFDWTTFLLELINFCVLLWILQRFLYRPVLTVVDARRRQILDEMAVAARVRAEAAELRKAVEVDRLALRQERARAGAELDQELAAERDRALARIETELNELRAKRQAQESREREEWRRGAERKALALAGLFCSALFRRLASPSLERNLVAIVVEDLAALDPPEADKLRLALTSSGVDAASAFFLADAERNQIASALGRVAGRPVDLAFHVEPSLIAGLRLRAGQWVLSANLGEELRFFTEAAGRSGR